MSELTPQQQAALEELTRLLLAAAKERLAKEREERKA